MKKIGRAILVLLALGAGVFLGKGMFADAPNQPALSVLLQPTFLPDLYRSQGEGVDRRWWKANGR